MFLQVTATKPHPVDAEVYFTSETGSTLGESKEVGTERQSTQIRGLLLGMIQGLRSIERKRTSSSRTKVTVGMEGAAFIEQLRNRTDAGDSRERDYDLWKQYLDLRSRYDIQFLAEGGRMLQCAS